VKYRSEIDGLRALAVLPVILFHAGSQTFAGGFVGVDVFFVISGYLITSLILADVEKGVFSIASFYERRARRILPALFLVMIVCVPVAWLLLPAPQMKDFAQSLSAVSLFGSNVLFWRESGYFDTAAELKPLLHTWSLGVEEQYYILFPPILVILLKLRAEWLWGLLGAGAALSLGLAEFSSSAFPAANFFLLPTRAWELLCGALGALYVFRNPRNKTSRVIAELAGTLGLALIAYSVLVYRESTPFPGRYALVPVLGTLLVILFATQQTTVGRLVGNRLFVGIGLISYSAYLWHQPLFAFYRNAAPATESTGVLLLLVFASLLLAYVSWRFVEKPFRDRQRTRPPVIASVAVAGTVFFFALGLVGHFNDGFSDAEASATRMPQPKTSQDFVVLGDSHGAHLITGLNALTTGEVADYTSNGCIPFRNVDRYDHRFVRGECVRKINGYLDALGSNDPDAYIVISSMGPVYLDGTPFKGRDPDRVEGLGVELITDKSVKDRWQVFETGLRNTLSELTQLKRAKVILAIDVPELGIDYGCWNHSKTIRWGSFLLRDLVKRVRPEECHVARPDYENRAGKYKALVKRVAAEFPSVILFDPTTDFCNASLCKGFDPSYGFLYRDFDHLSESGSTFLAERLVERAAQAEPARMPAPP
jgi:peptidoglycan/LPS O-acetylase OafA/YrhL